MVFHPASKNASFEEAATELFVQLGLLPGFGDWDFSTPKSTSSKTGFEMRLRLEKLTPQNEPYTALDLKAQVLCNGLGRENLSIVLDGHMLEFGNGNPQYNFSNMVLTDDSQGAQAAVFGILVSVLGAHLLGMQAYKALARSM